MCMAFKHSFSRRDFEDALFHAITMNGLEASLKDPKADYMTYALYFKCTEAI